MTNLENLLKTVEELDKAATPGPWENEDHRHRSGDWRSTGLIWSRNKGDCHPGTPVCQVECNKLYPHGIPDTVEEFENNAAFIAQARTLLPLMARIIALQYESLEILRFGPGNDMSGWQKTWAHEFAGKAQSRVDELCKGGE